LEVFRGCFTAPTFVTFVAMVLGLVAQTGRRTVCGMLLVPVCSCRGRITGRTGSSRTPGGTWMSWVFNWPS
jgi:hypothetical protein